MVPAGDASKIEPAYNSKILFIANANIPSLQLSFLTPLSLVPGDGRCDLLTEHDLISNLGKDTKSARGVEVFFRHLDACDPGIVVFCRYSGPHAPIVMQWARKHNIPVVFHLDDDLLNVPIELGAAKHAMHNHPDRLATVRYLLDHSTLVYCSTAALRRRLFGDSPPERAVAGSVYCAHSVHAPSTTGQPRVLGYMGFDHAHDFRLALPALVRLLDSRPDLPFEMFGTIPIPEDLQRFGDRIRLIEPVRNYAGFMEKLASLKWTVGICPLARTPFNEVKADTKWVEYTACGFATVASIDTVYGGCCAEGAGLLVDTEAEWLAALDHLLDDEAAHASQVERAQERLRVDYSPERLQQQIAEVFSLAHDLLWSQPSIGEEQAANEPAAEASQVLLLLDELFDDQIQGWAWTKSDGSASKAQEVELWCGSVKVGTTLRRMPRPDVDAQLGHADVEKGFLLPGSALTVLFRMLGGAEDLHPRVGFAGARVSLMDAQSSIHDLSVFQTIHKLVDPVVGNLADMWWANSRLLKIRTNARATDLPVASTTTLRIMQPLARSGDQWKLTTVDETALSDKGGIVAVGMRSPLLPIVIVGTDAQGHLTFVDLLPFPSLLRGGLHESESAAIGGETGSLRDICSLCDAFVFELTGWGQTDLPLAVSEVSIDIGRATGAEVVFDPAVRQWLAWMLRIKTTAQGMDERVSGDLGDPGFASFTLQRLAEITPSTQRPDRSRLHLPCDAIPTITAVTSRRLSRRRASQLAPLIIIDEAFPNRRSVVAPPDLAVTMEPISTPDYAAVLLGPGDDADTTGSADVHLPLGIAFRVLEPKSDLQRLFPVPKDVRDIIPASSSAYDESASVLTILPRATGKIDNLIQSIADQRVDGGVELLVGIADENPHRLGALREQLEDKLPGRGRLIHLPSVLQLGEARNRLAIQAAGKSLLVLHPAAILHDVRTIATLTRLASMPDTGTAGCMMLRHNPDEPSVTPVFTSAGYFPGRFDFAAAPQFALGLPDCSAILPNAVYPVVANASSCYAISTELWRRVGGLAAALFPTDGDLDLAVRLAEMSRVNVCTTRLSVTIASGPERIVKDTYVSPHIDLGRLVPAMRSSMTLRHF